MHGTKAAASAASASHSSETSRSSAKGRPTSSPIPIRPDSAVTKPDPSDKPAYIDYYSRLRHRKASLEADLDLVDADLKVAEAVVLSWYPDLSAEESTTAEGHCTRLKIGKKRNKRSIVSMLKVFKALGQKQFFSICSVSLEALENALGKVKAAAFLTEERSGYRQIKVIVKDGPPAA